MNHIAQKIGRKILAQCEIEGIKKEDIDYELIMEADLIKQLHSNHRVFVFYYEPDNVEIHKLYGDILSTLSIPHDIQTIGKYEGNYFFALPKGCT